MEYKAFLVLDREENRYIIEGKDKFDAYERARWQLGFDNVTMCEELKKEELLVYCAA